MLKIYADRHRRPNTPYIEDKYTSYEIGMLTRDQIFELGPVIHIGSPHLLDTIGFYIGDMKLPAASFEVILTDDSGKETIVHYDWMGYLGTKWKIGYMTSFPDDLEIRSLR